MKKTTIYHIGFRHPSNDNRIYMKECISLAKNKNYEVTYITSDVSGVTEDDVIEDAKRIVLHTNSKRVIRQFVFFREIKKILKADMEVDVVHLHETTLLLIALWMKRRGIKVIFDSHEDYYEQIKLSRNAFIAGIYKTIEKYVCSRIDGVIFPCKMLNKKVFDYPIKHFEYIDNYPIISNFNFDERDNLGIKEIVPCYTGTISYERGAINTIRAWNQYGVKGKMAGVIADKESRDAILNKYKANVEYVGWIDPQKLSTFYKQCSIGMAILLNKGQYHQSCNFPTKVCEYMMHGLPVIIYRTPYVEEIMKRYKFGLMVDPDNVDEIVSALDYLNSNRNELIDMSVEGRRAVIESFNWEKEEKKLLAFYRDVLQG